MLRRSPRAFLLWAGAAGVALATGSVVAGDLSTLHRRVATLGPLETVVVARRALPLGTTIVLGDVTTRRVHSSQQPAGVVHDVDDVLGRVVRVPLVRSAFVTASHLAPRGRDGLAGALPAGTRAVRIPVEHGLRPRPGSVVEVYASYGGGVDALGTARYPTQAVVVATAAVVLADDDEGVTLLVDEAEAAALADAAARGSLFLALVPPEDARPGAGVTRR
jgi:Flp pilus assembly protein CpaB